MILISANNHHYQYFDWEYYLATYRQIIDNKFDTKDRVWWHFTKIGEPKGFSYFNIYHRDYHKSIFNWKDYSSKNSYLFLQGYKKPEQFWEHFISARNVTDKNKQLFYNKLNNNFFIIYILLYPILKYLFFLI